MKMTSFYFFLIILLLGILLRLHALSPNNIYPDVYQNLLVAENIQKYHSVTGFLGKEGMSYPPYFMWSHPVYPLLILSLFPTLHSLLNSARVITFISGIVGILLSYCLGYSVFRNKRIAFSASLLLSLSFNHTVWSGFLLTEPVGVSCMLLFLTLFFWDIETDKKLFNVQDVLLGVLFSLLIFTRYEYVILIVSILFAYFVFSPTPWKRISIFLPTIFLTSSIIFSSFFPISETIQLILAQMHDILLKAFPLIPFGILFCVLYYYRKNFLRFIDPAKLIVYVLWILIFFLLICKLITITTILGFEFSGVQNFLIDEPLLLVSFLIGSSYALLTKSYTKYIMFALFSMLLLYPFYHIINPAMERYMTHLIPFMLLPAAYGLSIVFNIIITKAEHKRTNIYLNQIAQYFKNKNRKNSFIVIILLVLIYQIFLTFQGLRNWGDKSWYDVSYDESAAKRVATSVSGKEILLITSLPEPYYFYTQNSTQSVSNEYPFVNLDASPNDRVIWIIEDMGMRDLFPAFSHFLDTQFSDRRVTSFWVHAPYHFGAKSQPETAPVTIYSTSVVELQQRIHHELTSIL